MFYSGEGSVYIQYNTLKKESASHPSLLAKESVTGYKCGEVRSKKFFQNLKELIKTRLVMYFSTQTDEMPMRTTRITDLFNIQEGSKSPSGGNQVDGLPPAPVRDLFGP